MDRDKILEAHNLIMCAYTNYDNYKNTKQIVFFELAQTQLADAIELIEKEAM